MRRHDAAAMQMAGCQARGRSPAAPQRRRTTNSGNEGGNRDNGADAVRGERC
jgi:hypothetical protein